VFYRKQFKWKICKDVLMRVWHARYSVKKTRTGALKKASRIAPNDVSIVQPSADCALNYARANRLCMKNAAASACMPAAAAKSNAWSMHRITNTAESRRKNAANAWKRVPHNRCVVDNFN
jgi:hypothetical protein